jgi:hypothetical protein
LNRRSRGQELLLFLKEEKLLVCNTTKYGLFLRIRPYRRDGLVVGILTGSYTLFNPAAAAAARLIS